MKINYSKEYKIQIAGKARRVNDVITYDDTETLKADFSEHDICLMAVRHMRNSESSKESNKKRAATDRLILKGVKATSKDLFKKDYDELTEEEKAETLQTFKDSMKG